MSRRRISLPASARTATTAELTEPNLRRPSGDPAGAFAFLAGSFRLLRVVRDWSRSLKSGFESRPLRTIRCQTDNTPVAGLTVDRTGPATRPLSRPLTLRSPTLGARDHFAT